MSVTIDIPGLEGWLQTIALGVAAFVVLNLLRIAIFGRGSGGSGDSGSWSGDGDGGDGD